MPEDVRKPLTFIAIVCIFLAVGLGWDKVKAFQVFQSDFSEGKDRGQLYGKGEAQALIYKVEPGDTWGKIAREHSVSTRALLDANDANIGTELRPGQNIHLPGAAPVAPPASAGAAH
jgi:hypothetical protein